MTEFEDEVLKRLAGLDIGQSEMRHEIRTLSARVAVQNGRVAKLEDGNHIREMSEAEARGAASARAGLAFALTKAQWGTLAGAIAMVAAVAGGVAALIERIP